MDYLTVTDFFETTFTEKKSEFIGSISHVESPDDAIKFIFDVKNLHKAAKHYVYVYTCRKDNTLRYSDDGEPSGKAALPALEVIKQNELQDVCLVVTRYFGGILLGGGGLARAYSKSASLTINKAKIVKMTECLEGYIKCDYSLLEKILYILKNNDVVIKNTEYLENIKIIFKIKKENRAEFEKIILENTSGKAELKFLFEDYSPFPV